MPKPLPRTEAPFPEPDAPGLCLYEDDAAAIDSLFRQALEHQGDTAFGEFLHFVRRFRRHSVFNAMLIRTQRPGAMAVGTRLQWKEIGREVNADAVPIVILRPFGPVDFVYELGDTSGRAIRGMDEDPLAAKGKVPPLMWDRVVLGAERCGVVVEVVDHYGFGLAGTAAPLHQDQADAFTEPAGGDALWRVKVNGRLDEVSRLATLAHELAHVYCGHLGHQHRRPLWPDRRLTLTLEQRELEAEAAAWLVCQREGIAPRSAAYLSDYISTEALQGISVFAIMAAAHRIEARGVKPKDAARGKSGLPAAGGVPARG